MSRIAKKNHVAATIIFAASGLSLFSGSAYANDCPSGDFTRFLSAFSATPDAQQRFTAMTVKTLVLKPAAQSDQFEPLATGVTKADLAFPLMAPLASDNTEGVKIQKVDDSHITVVDKRAGNSNIKVFNFSRQACWVLEGLEDWSINEKYLSASSKPEMGRAESYCFQRGEVYAGLGGLGQYRLSREFFEAALENYICAAASGDPQASLEAASLSLSGMAPQLETPKVEALLKAAATTLADGASGLSTFYCYGNTIAGEGACQNPELAEKELIRAASMGSVDAINYLGYTFERGELTTKDVPRAMACYRLAADKGNQTAAMNVERLKTQVADMTAARNCY
ncbi:sel1 repeat family protein [Pseudomonas lijiangensis]|uniref:Sel1 repeat family protein n=1 Tax=Pseudomonas serbiensis TaxID=3064350 RepID=A0ABT9CY59_9PSED|nr:sel1 repeat family protein [Pseudomonas sp. KFB-138]MDO7930429.1 sel1 repeat family protein [Pseudomonas sp. KFB-138]